MGSPEMDNHEGNALNNISNITSVKEVIIISKRKNLVGQVFGDFTVIEMLWNYQNKRHTYCKCKGIDNKEYIIRQDALTSGATRTIHGACTGGVMHDITGNRYGRLTALRPIDERASNGGVRWECLCDCGNYVYPTKNNLERGHTTSCGCAKEDYIESTKLDIIGKRFGKLIVLEEVFPPNRRRRMVKCLCDCGNIIICSVSDLVSGHTQSCGCDRESKGEKWIKEFLDNLNIKYISQKRFPDCKNIRTLPFDFYLPDYNMCIEFDGSQHYRPIEYWGGEEQFKYRQHNDDIKNTYCINKGIDIIHISYKTKKKEIFEILQYLTSPATITA